MKSGYRSFLVRKYWFALHAYICKLCPVKSTFIDLVIRKLLKTAIRCTYLTLFYSVIARVRCNSVVITEFINNNIKIGDLLYKKFGFSILLMSVFKKWMRLSIRGCIMLTYLFINDRLLSNGWSDFNVFKLFFGVYWNILMFFSFI